MGGRTLECHFCNSPPISTGVIPKSLPVLSTEPILRKAAVDRGLRFSTEHALICICGIFVFSPILLSINCHSDYDTIDGRIIGNRHPYPNIFQSSIKSPRVHELCETHFFVEA